MSRQKIGIGIIVIAVIALAVVMSGLLTIVSGTFDFAGFKWEDSGTSITDSCNYGGGQANLNLGSELTISASGSRSTSRTAKTDIMGIDELLVIYEGSASCYGSSGYSGGSGSIGAAVYGSESGSIGLGKTQSCSANDPPKSAVFQPSIWKFKNNFDGTWSSLESLGVGDVFIVRNTAAIKGNPLLALSASAGGSCDKGGGASNLIIYNIVRKENAFALCKADQFVQDKNGDGKIASDGSECFDLATIVLNSEEAIKESYDEKIARITTELEAKNAGLQEQINTLQQQAASQQTSSQITMLQQQIAMLQAQLATASDKTAIQSQIDALRQQQLSSGNLQDQLDALRAELKETKTVLNAVQAKDKNVIAVIENQEQFKKPSFIARFFNAIISFFKNLFA